MFEPSKAMRKRAAAKPSSCVFFSPCVGSSVMYCSDAVWGYFFASAGSAGLVHWQSPLAAGQERVVSLSFEQPATKLPNGDASFRCDDSFLTDCLCADKELALAFFVSHNVQETSGAPIHC